MDCAFAIKGSDFIILANDRSVMRSIMKLQDTDTKTIKLSSTQLLTACGEISDRKNFTKLIEANMEYYYYLNGTRLTTDEAASYVRTTLAEGIRSSPYQCNVIVAGYDSDGPKLYWLDYLGSMGKVNKAAQGYGAYFLYGLMDNYYKKDFNYEDACDCVRKCIKELKTRFLVNLVDYDVFKISKDGIQDVSDEFNQKKEGN